MIFIFLILLCTVNAEGSKEGDNCIKEGVAGVCTNIRDCLAALQDIENRKEPQICEFIVDPIVCCIPSVTTSSTTTTTTTTTTARPTGKCVLPPYPKQGTYSTNVLNGIPGDAYDIFVVNITCRHGFVVDGSRSVFCQNGWWTEPMPNCVPACHLMPHPSVENYCIVSDGRVNGTRACEEYEPQGTVVRPSCRTPHYYSPTELGLMRCDRGLWNYIATCNPDCGAVIEDASPRGNKTTAKRGEVPWHAGIYTKTTRPYKQICGGSLISTSVIISAAHCFWSDVERKLPESHYAVGVGKLYRPWNEPKESEQAQYSDIHQIHLPARFQGSAANYQEDIAVLIMHTPFVLTPHVWPVCLDFNINIEKEQLQPGTMGKIGGWGLTDKNGKASQVLKIIEVPYVSIETCISESPFAFRDYITSDKMCAGDDDESIPLCKGDSGGGLAFPKTEKDKTRYYLRGILSIDPNYENLCNTRGYKFFTQVSKHEHFIKQF